MAQPPAKTQRLERAIQNLTLLGIMVPFALITGIPPSAILGSEFGQDPAYVWYSIVVFMGFGFMVTLGFVLSRESFTGKAESSSGIERVESLSAEGSFSSMPNL